MKQIVTSTTTEKKTENKALKIIVRRLVGNRLVTGLAAGGKSSGTEMSSNTAM